MAGRTNQAPCKGHKLSQSLYQVPPSRGAFLSGSPVYWRKNVSLWLESHSNQLNSTWSCIDRSLQASEYHQDRTSLKHSMAQIQSGRLYAASRFSFSGPGFQVIWTWMHQLFWIFLQFCCLMYTFSLQKPSKKQQKPSILGCLQKLCRKQFPGFSSSVCRSYPNIL